MSVIGRLVVSIVGNNTELKKSLQDTDKLLTKQTKNINYIADQMAKAGKVMTLGVTLPIVGVGIAFSKLAMDAVESENLFEVSMGSMADSARKWSEGLSDSLGLNQYEIRKTVGTFNVMFDSMGIGKQAAYDMATSMTQLAYDMASFYNLDTEEAFQKLQAGITGEAEPLKRLGIIINETTIQKYALKEGIIPVGETMTEQEKVQARYIAIMDQTAKAQGDLARTMESPSNQLRILKDQAKEAAISFGELLLPSISKMLGAANNLIKWFKDLDDSGKKTITNIGLIAAAIGPLLLVGSSLIKMFTGIRTAVTLTNTALKGFAGSLAIGNVAVLGIAGGLFNAITAITGIADTIKKARDGTYEWKEALTRFSSPMLILLDNIDWVDEAFKKTFGRDLKENMEDSSGSTKKLSLEMLQLRNNLNGVKEKTEETTESVDDLVSSLNDLYNLNQSVTESTWDYEDSLTELDKVLSDSNATEREKQKALFDVQDATEQLLVSIFKEYEAEGTSIERKKELQEQLLEVGAKAVEMKTMSVEAFIEYAKRVGLSKDEINKYLDEVILKIQSVPEKRTFQLLVQQMGVNKAYAFFDWWNRLPNTQMKTVIYRLQRLDAGMASGGIIGYSGGGVVNPILSASAGMITPSYDNGGILSLLHKNEVVLNAGQTKNLAELIFGLANTRFSGSQEYGDAGAPITINNVIELDGSIIYEKTEEHLYRSQRLKQIGAGIR